MATKQNIYEQQMIVSNKFRFKVFCSVDILWMPLKCNKRMKIHRIVLLHHGYSVADVPYYYISFKTIKKESIFSPTQFFIHTMCKTNRGNELWIICYIYKCNIFDLRSWCWLILLLKQMGYYINHHLSIMYQF